MPIFQHWEQRDLTNLGNLNTYGFLEALDRDECFIIIYAALKKESTKHKIKKLRK